MMIAISFNFVKLRDFTAGQLFNQHLFYSTSYFTRSRRVADEADYDVIKIPCDLPLLECWNWKKSRILREFGKNVFLYFFLILYNVT